jgi:pyruvate,water dikinase
MSLDDAERLNHGEVLVCPATMPPWTPLFAVASAVVTDHGGVLSHTAIVAREYQIPAVVGTKVGTSLIKDGSTITVDGGEGTVRMES